MRSTGLLLGVIVSSLPAALFSAEPLLIPVRIDGPTHDPENHSYWFGPFSECASVLDVDGDGDLDLAAGRNWYEAPDWKKHENFRDGAETNGPETDDNSEFAMDVNRDGRMDIVSSGWMRMKGAFWYENPGPEGLKSGKKWKATRFHAAKNMEGVVHGDIDGDGDDDILCNHWAPVPGQAMTWLESIDREPWLVEHRVGTEGEHHGNGLGDINGDGRVDIVTPTGWYEQPAKLTNGPWTFHADYTFEIDGKYAPASHPMLVYDVDEDGLSDIIVGSSHNYGLAWLEQSVDPQGKRTFTQHWAETDFGQFHTMTLGDLNGDGKPDLVTGKRLFAHHGRDTSCYEPLFAFWYDIQGGRFQRHILSFNHLPWYSGKNNQNPPPTGAIGMGMKVIVVDLDADGDNDIVAPGKSGLYVFYNTAVAPQPRPKHNLLPEETYPSWIPWHGR
ncbi:MAG: VCBS repeat-containing protein [Thermoguttaceae bacterium]